jgi:hypothetical protein
MTELFMRGARKLLLTGLVVAGLAGGLAIPGHASAQQMACRSDPVIVLSNLATIDVEAGIGDSISDVRSITYVVHGPIGTRPLFIVNTDGLVGLVEHFQYYADQSWGKFASETTVTTGMEDASVQPSMVVVSALGVTLGAAVTSGLSGQTLSLHLSSLL